MRIRKGRKKRDCCSFQSFDYFLRQTHTDTHAGTNSRRRRETSVYRRPVDSFDTSYLFPQTFTNVERRTQMFSSAHSTIKKKGEKRKKKKKQLWPFNDISSATTWKGILTGRQAREREKENVSFVLVATPGYVLYTFQTFRGCETLTMLPLSWCRAGGN